MGCELQANAIQDPGHMDSHISELETFVAHRQTGSLLVAGTRYLSSQKLSHGTRAAGELIHPEFQTESGCLTSEKHHRAARHWSHTAPEVSHDMSM